MRKLADTYGGRSTWANANKDRPKTLQHARTMAEELIRNLAKSMHADAQQNANLLMAGSVLAVVPSVIVFLLLQRQFVRGISMSGLKG